MKKASTISIIILLLIASESRGQKQTGNNDIITIDVRKTSPPKKELILQDIMDVEYIALETTDEFVNEGVVRAIGRKYILVTNRNDDGDIFVYDRTGKALKKINRKGQQTSREYVNASQITLDEDNREMFVNDYYTRRILVYDLDGKFKRSFKHRKGIENQFRPTAGPLYTQIYNYDKNKLFCYENSNPDGNRFFLISKKDGSIIKEIKLPFKDNVSTSVTSDPVTTITAKSDNHMSSTVQTTTVGPGVSGTIIPYKGNLTLMDPSSDTVYTFFPDYSLRPFLVRTPPVRSMNTKILLKLCFLSERYLFMESIECVYDWETRTGFPETPFLYDNMEKASYSYSVYNGDYSTKQEIKMGSFIVIDADWLVKDYRKGKLKDGKLKEIASKLKEDDNPVIMLIKPKEMKYK